MSAFPPEPNTDPLGSIPPDGSSFAVGKVVSGKYLIEHELGEGGVGIVMAARHLELDIPVALKFMRPEVSRDRKIAKRFLLEAKASVAIKNEHVASVLDVGRAEDGSPFMVFEHMSGKDLGTLISDGTGFSISDAVDYTLQVCEGLAVAHALGIVHRDIKPDNLFLETVHGVNIVKIIDFGISRQALVGDAIATEAHEQPDGPEGTPVYMAPEQMRMPNELDPRTDIWALGATLYELLTGTTAFTGTSVAEVCRAVLEREPVSLLETRPDVPDALAAIVSKCLAKDRELRFHDVAELAIALLPFAPKRARISVERAVSTLNSVGMTTGRLDVRSVPPPTTHINFAAPTQPAQRARRSAQPWIFAVIAAALLAAGTAFVLRGNGTAASYSTPEGAANTSTTGVANDPAQARLTAPSAYATNPSAQIPSAGAVASAALVPSSDASNSPARVLPHGPGKKGKPLAPQIGVLPKEKRSSKDDPDLGY